MTLEDQTIAGMRACIRTILCYPHIFKWTTQGLGMMRTYVGPPSDPKQWRLNIWHSSLATPNVSTMHDHPWHFTSWIINGQFTNVRFDEDSWNGDDFDFMVIKCGVDGGPENTGGRIRLRALPPENYTTGDTYEQEPTEIHRSIPSDGTVTLNLRKPVGDGEHARVFWPAGTHWVDAKPRDSTAFEIDFVTAKALSQWQS